MSDNWIEVTIPAASVKTLNSSPYEIIPAMAGYKILVDQAILTLIYNSTPYSFLLGTLNFAYGGGGPAVTANITAAILTSSQETSAAAMAIDIAPTAESSVENQSIVLKASANPTSGNSDLYVKIYHSYIPSP